MNIIRDIPHKLFTMFIIKYSQCLSKTIHNVYRSLQPRYHERPNLQWISSQRPSRSFECTSCTFAYTLRQVAGSWSCSTFGAKSWVVTVTARKSLVWTYSGWVIIYCCDMLSFLIIFLLGMHEPPQIWKILENYFQK